MKNIGWICLLIATVFLVQGCQRSSEKLKTEVSGLKRIESKWFDSVTVAEATPKIALASQVNNLQVIQRELKELPGDICIGDAKYKLDLHMDYIIRGFVDFMGGNESAARAALSLGKESLGLYTKALQVCECRAQPELVRCK